MTADQVLDALRVPGRGAGPSWHVYHVGCHSTPLNFASQQLRAFHLVQALEEKELVRNRKVVVVGARLAGITAAISCFLRGARKVTIYERNHECLAYQHGASHRFVHPHIFRWPDESANRERTDFPILNWSAGNADAIRATLIKQFTQLLAACLKRRGLTHSPDVLDYAAAPEGDHHPRGDDHKEKFRLRLGCDVRSISPFLDKQRPRLSVIAEGQEALFVHARGEYLPVGPIRNYQRSYDVAIVAAGFGLEAEVAGVPFRSYWNLDVLSQPTIRGTWPRRWLVSGTGDGGLIDAIRLRLFDVDQATLTGLLLGTRDLSGLGVTAGQWSNTTASACEGMMEALRRDLKGFDERLLRGTEEAVAEEFSGRSHAAFAALRERHKDAFEGLRCFLEAKERTDTVVYLNGPSAGPYQPSASLFNRFLVYLLRRHCGLRFRRGRLKLLSPPGYAGAFRVAFDQVVAGQPGSVEEIIEVDEIVVRHGAESALERLFGAAVARDVRDGPAIRAFDADLWNRPLPPEWSKDLKKPVLPKEGPGNWL